MKKNKNWHNKGFVLVETLIATVFVSAIFIIIYMNFYPLMGEYEKRENYEEVDTVYQTFWLKYIIINSNAFEDQKEAIDKSIYDYGYYELNFDTIYGDNTIPQDLREKFKNIYQCKNSKVQKIVITGCNLDLLSSVAYKTNNLKSLTEYVNSLPSFCSNNNNYKMIVEYSKDYKTGTKEADNYSSFVNLDFNFSNNDSDDNSSIGEEEDDEEVEGEE